MEGYKDLTETILDCNFVSSECDRASSVGSSSSSTMENRNRLKAVESIGMLPKSQPTLKRGKMVAAPK